MGFIDRPQFVWWRKALFQVHLWTGVILGLYVIAISISGSVLVFQRELLDDTPRLGNDRVAGPTSFGDAVAIAQSAHPGEPLADIDMRTRDRRVVQVALQEGSDQRIVYVDTVTRRIVGDEILQKKHCVMTFLEDLHNELAGGQKGAVVNGAGGALLFLMSVTGIVLWWPGQKNWKRALNVKWNARWARVNWDIHSAFGFWSLVFVAMWGLTGAYFIFPKPFTKTIALFSPMAHMREKPSEWVPGEAILPVEAYVDKAMWMHPHTELAYVFMNVNHAHGVVQVYLSRDPKFPLPLMEDLVTFQPATAAVLSDMDSANWTPGERLSLAVYSIHFGDFGGVTVKILWFVLGLIPVVLTCTGYVMWWNRVLKKKWASWKEPARATVGATARTIQG